MAPLADPGRVHLELDDAVRSNTDRSNSSPREIDAIRREGKRADAQADTVTMEFSFSCVSSNASDLQRCALQRASVPRCV